jgi:hypothetical protein
MASAASEIILKCGWSKVFCSWEFAIINHE